MKELKDRTHFSSVKTEQDAMLPVPISLYTSTYPMAVRASIRLLSKTQTTLHYKLEGLSMAANKYVKFDMAVRDYYTGRQVYYETWPSSNTSNTTDHKATGLTAGTKYEIICEALSNKWYPVGSDIETTSEAPDTTGPKCSNLQVSHSGWINQKQVAVSFSASDNKIVKEMHLGWKRSWESSYKTLSKTGLGEPTNSWTFYFNIDDLDYTVEYNFVGWAKDNSGNTSSESQKVYGSKIIGYDKTGPVIDSLTAGMRGKGIAAIARATDSRSGVAGYAYYISGPNDNIYGSANIVYGSGQTEKVFNTDRGGNALVDGRKYKIKVTSWDKLDNWASTQKELTFTYSRPAPSEWTWSATAKTAFTQRGYTTALKVSEWNSFIKKLIEFSQWYDPNLETGSLSKCEMNTLGKNTLLATDFNTIKNRILTIKTNSWHMVDVGKGHMVRGQYFLDMETALNSCSKNLLQTLEQYENETDEEAYERLFIELENAVIPEYPPQRE